MLYAHICRCCLLGAAAVVAGAVASADAAWNTSNTNGNPVVPGYFADPSIIYDSTTQTFYIYSTTDGVWISYSGEPQVWSSKDFVNWKCQPMTLPSGWPTTQLWAPSAMRHPTNGRYYLMYCSNSGVYIAQATSPLGPWSNAADGSSVDSITGRIGLGTWNTQVQFDSVRVTSGASTLFSDDFGSASGSWTTYYGTWAVSGGTYNQSGTNTPAMTAAPTISHHSYTYSVRARKTGGNEGFLVIFGMKDTSNYYWWNIGGWTNTAHRLQKCVAGTRTSIGTSVSGSITTNQWYTITITVTGNNIKCYLNGALIHDYSEGDGPLYTSGQLTGGSDWIDPQFFIDTNTVYFTFGQSSVMGIAKLAFNPSTHLVHIDSTDSRMTNGATYKCKLLSGLTNALEGSCMFRNGSTYFMTYSSSACQNYNVQYAYATSPVGPFTHPTGQILVRNNTTHVLGPGHNSILRYGSTWYICYHRQHYQYVDVKRQTCMDQITVSGTTISTGEQSQEGVWSGSGSLETLVANARVSLENDLAFGKTVLASSESAYKGGTSGNISETFAAITGFYADSYAVDRNNGTRWAPASLPGNLIVDLGADYSVGRCETTFEYVMRWYRYRIEYLAASEAANITAAQGSSAWHLFADRSSNSQFPS
ncbi:MAG: family 43 glycosylhydrolase, partial [Chitinispirillaceae bacterium]|nr:family 43 glycosylhydrolase [Chitinispirillaceae bacterium]